MATTSRRSSVGGAKADEEPAPPDRIVTSPVRDLRPLATSTVRSGGKRRASSSHRNALQSAIGRSQRQQRGHPLRETLPGEPVSVTMAMSQDGIPVAADAGLAINSIGDRRCPSARTAPAFGSIGRMREVPSARVDSCPQAGRAAATTHIATNPVTNTHRRRVPFGRRAVAGPTGKPVLGPLSSIRRRVRPFVRLSLGRRCILVCLPAFEVGCRARRPGFGPAERQPLVTLRERCSRDKKAPCGYQKRFQNPFSRANSAAVRRF